jgi:hypothetical protein
MKDVTIYEKDGQTELEIVPFKIKVRFDKENLEIVFEGNTNKTIAIKGDTKFLFDGDTHFITNGELGFITKDNDIHMDSINANIHLNSRLSKPIKDLPESIKERQKFEDNTFPMLNDMPENETGNLEKRIAFLEEMLGV